MNIPLPGKDWMVLADEMEYSNTDIQVFGSTKHYMGPTYVLLDHWQRKQSSTVGVLLKMLLNLERDDVYCDILPHIGKAYSVVNSLNILMKRTL